MKGTSGPTAATGIELEPVIGLEVHVQLATHTKLFCADPAEFGAEPNRNVCPVCLGLPGSLPVLDPEALDLAIRAAIGLDCTLQPVSVFARKNYFYPDLPKGYQITQFEQPLAKGGWLDTEPAGTRVRIRRVHIEEDAGKSLHDRVPGRTAVDLNRAGTALIEIVSEPDLGSPSAARRFLDRLKQVLQYLKVSDCDMEKGSLRVDANVSVRPRGSSALGTKTEVKNMNSFANLERALRFEIERQVGLVAGGGTVVHQTLLWDSSRGEARPMRAKEQSRDYRFFAEPDLPPVVPDPERIAEIRSGLPELPAAKERRFRERYELPDYDIGVLTATPELADFYEGVAESSGDPKAASNWTMTEVLAWANREQRPVGELPVSPEHVGELVRLVGEGRLSGSMARSVFSRMLESGSAPSRIVEDEGLAQIRDTAQLERWVEEVLAENRAEAARYGEGERKLLGFFMGEVMRKSGGKADPREASRILRHGLEGS